MSAMIHAAIFATTDPAERATLIVSGSVSNAVLNAPSAAAGVPRL